MYRIANIARMRTTTMLHVWTSIQAVLDLTLMFEISPADSGSPNMWGQFLQFVEHLRGAEHSLTAPAEVFSKYRQRCASMHICHTVSGRAQFMAHICSRCFTVLGQLTACGARFASSRFLGLHDGEEGPCRQGCWRGCSSSTQGGEEGEGRGARGRRGRDQFHDSSLEENQEAAGGSHEQSELQCVVRCVCDRHHDSLLYVCVRTA